MNFIGIDLGTSSVKTLVIDENENVTADLSEDVVWSSPHPNWSEADPESWWDAVARTLDRLAGENPGLLKEIRGIGLSGQMHGAVLLDGAHKPLRPAILWNDGRSHREAAELASLPSPLLEQLGVMPMPGLTGPKLLWLHRHEPETLAATRSLLLPKDYIRLKLCGELATDVSDAAGTWMFDQAGRCWSEAAIKICGADPAWLPKIYESNEATGILRKEWVSRWGLPNDVVIAAGGGDAAMGGVGIGAISNGDAFISLGTSAQLFVAADQHRPSIHNLVHAFCHAVPQGWYQMAAMLSGASPLAAAARWLEADIPLLLQEAEQSFRGPSKLIALPYLEGERTPHNDPFARGVIFGLDNSATRADITQAVLEGVAFMLVDALDTLKAAGASIETAAFIGGGARSSFWAKLIASATGLRLQKFVVAERGPAFGAARLARLAVTGENPRTILLPPKVQSVIEPDPALHRAYQSSIDRFRRLYQALKPVFRPASESR
ncbi:xylulokinase [Beijerinckia indica]|uniref:Xylulose kinase n=1 Tax=Beijerinckia indica subsp. indica (strain ATCC 9039 / DSM 1715 / NCIMB 8712) TaxID=395963 RepID=B2IBW2_BEII9|nr:xylulokinase [Beijerinckia indica]ACB93834.1 xylulokinase [Beijerinckia indica subsp. indica ATCC 9039]